MAHPPVDRLLTAEDLLELGSDDYQYELVRGRLVVSEPPTHEHGSIALNIGMALRAFTRPRGLGRAVVESGYVLERGPDTVRGPNVSFVRRERVPRGDDREKFVEGHPDLAVEIVSPGDRAGKIARKVGEYLTCGAGLVWVVYPGQRLVVVHAPDGGKRMVREPGSLDGGGVLPGFTLPLAEVFAED